MANVIVKATQVGERASVKGYSQYGAMRLRHVINNAGAYSASFIEIPTLPEMMRITATTEVTMVFANQPEQAEATAVSQNDINELEGKGIDNIGLNGRPNIIVVPAGEVYVYRKRHEKYIAFKGTGFFEAW